MDAAVTDTAGEILEQSGQTPPTTLPVQPSGLPGQPGGLTSRRSRRSGHPARDARLCRIRGFQGATRAAAPSPGVVDRGDVICIKSASFTCNPCHRSSQAAVPVSTLEKGFQVDRAARHHGHRPEKRAWGARWPCRVSRDRRHHGRHAHHPRLGAGTVPGQPQSEALRVRLVWGHKWPLISFLLRSELSREFEGRRHAGPRQALHRRRVGRTGMPRQDRRRRLDDRGRHGSRPRRDRYRRGAGGQGGAAEPSTVGRGLRPRNGPGT